jgi:hypothetical protein
VKESKTYDIRIQSNVNPQSDCANVQYVTNDLKNSMRPQEAAETHNPDNYTANGEHKGEGYTGKNGMDNE